MKKGFLVDGFCLVLFLMADMGVKADPLGSATLYAGQSIEVGQVEVENDSGALVVRYVITEPGWCLQQVHVDVAGEPAGIPQTKSGNPIVGQFQVNEPAQSCESHEVHFDTVPNGDFVVAAHAVVADLASCQSEGVLYGTLQGPIPPPEGDDGDTDGWIEAIDVVNCTTTQLFRTGDPAPADGNTNSPNGLAYDALNNKLYFSATDEEAPHQTDLFEVDLDLSSQNWILTLDGTSYGATFFGGNYLYMINNSDRLRNVTPFVPLETSYCGDVDGGGFDGHYRFGDIVVAPGTQTLYGSVVNNGSDADSSQLFFSFDLQSCPGLTVLCRQSTNSDCADSLQLAYGSNGVLYGHSSDTGDFFEIDPATGLKLNGGAAVCNTDPKRYTDLASSAQCSPETETAWGDGTLFSGHSWATYIYIENPL